MSITILGRCETCGQERPVRVEAYPGISSTTNIVMVSVVALCEECESTVDYTWCSLQDLRPDWTEYQKAREEAGL